jgi:hypothetical protein
MNKTERYLLPTLYEYGAELHARLHSMTITKCGIGDSSFGEEFTNHIFLLVDASIETGIFTKSLEWIKDQTYFELDYAYGDIHKSSLHMIILKLPEWIDLKLFTKGEYSKLIPEDKRLLYKDDITKDILNKRFGGIVYYKAVIRKEFGTQLNDTDCKDAKEYDIPPQKEVEVFK